MVGAFRHIGKDDIADDILRTMRGFGYDVRETNPFEKPADESLAFRSPYEARITLMWKEMREQIFPLIDRPEKKVDDFQWQSERYTHAWSGRCSSHHRGVTI